MAAITKSFSVIADSAADRDSPVDTALVTGLRDNDIHLREWLGASFTAGAVQDHNHDGINSAAIEVGPSLNRNGSFEDGESGWTFTDFTGGSHAISTTVNQHGAQSIAITSTVLANGGGEAETSNIICAGGDYIPIKYWYHASVANVSSKVELDWYQADGTTYISSSTVHTTTNSPTASTRVDAAISVPTNARYYRIKITGGIPGSGSATGTIYFDGIVVTDLPIIQGPHLGAGSVNQAALKTTTGQASVTNNNTTWTLPGGEYGFFVQIRSSAGQNMGWFDHDTPTTGFYNARTASTSYTMNLRFGAIVSTTAYMMQRYIQASPPYDLGDGEVQLFVFIVVDKSGNIEAVSVTPDPPWANNGPTNIRPDYLKNKKPFKKIYRQKKDKGKLILPIELEEQEIEVTSEYKNTDMPLIPHPFQGNDLTDKTIVLIDPVSDLCCHFGELHNKGQSINELLHEGHIKIDNTSLPRKTPPGVIAVAPRWKLTR